MKESYYYWKRIFNQLYNDLIKKTLILFGVGCLIVFAIWRLNPIAYIICFMFCFAIISFFYFRKKEVKNEFKENQ